MTPDVRAPWPDFCGRSRFYGGRFFQRCAGAEEELPWIAARIAASLHGVSTLILNLCISPTSEATPARWRNSRNDVIVLVRLLSRVGIIVRGRLLLLPLRLPFEAKIPLPARPGANVPSRIV